MLILMTTLSLLRSHWCRNPQNKPNWLNWLRHFLRHILRCVLRAKPQETTFSSGGGGHLEIMLQAETPNPCKHQNPKAGVYKTHPTCPRYCGRSQNRPHVCGPNPAPGMNENPVTQGMRDKVYWETSPASAKVAEAAIVETEAVIPRESCFINQISGTNLLSPRNPVPCFKKKKRKNENMFKKKRGTPPKKNGAEAEVPATAHLRTGKWKNLGAAFGTRMMYSMLSGHSGLC